MALAHWIVGPQIVGLIIVIVGLVQKYYPPKRINDLYGYRSETAKQNQQTWNEANRYSANLMVKSGFIAVVTGLIMTPFIAIKYEWIMAVSASFTGIGCAVILMIKTENHLEKTFNKKSE